MGAGGLEESAAMSSILVTDNLLRLFERAAGLEDGHHRRRTRAGLDFVFEHIEEKIRAAAHFTEEQRSDFRRAEARASQFNGRGFRGKDRIDTITEFVIGEVLKELRRE